MRASRRDLPPDVERSTARTHLLRQRLETFLQRAVDPGELLWCELWPRAVAGSRRLPQLALVYVGL